MEQVKLDNFKVAILATDGFEQSEFEEPRQALENNGATVDIISIKSGEIKAWNKGNWGKTVKVDKTVGEATPGDYQALVLPGGVMNPDKLRMDERAVTFTKSFLEDNKPVAAICHGPWLLVETGLLKGRRMTSYESIQTDIKNAGAEWVNEEVVKDNNLITSRKPDDIPAFIDTMLQQFAEEVQVGQTS